MKRLLIFPFLITLLLSSCSGKKYNSKYEANRACREWKNNGFEYSYEYTDFIRDKYGQAVSPYEYTIRTFSSDSRRCIYESQTRQYIGKENISVQKNIFYKIDEWKELKNKIKYKYKNFYF